jgi:SAM-dependent methyltransferase
MKQYLAFRIFKHILNYFVYIISYTRNYARLSFELLRDYCLDKKLNIRTAESDHAPDSLSLFKDGKNYEATPYHILKKIADHLKPGPEDAFIDFGSGKGRAVFFMALQRLKKVTGVELNKELIDIARENLDNFRLGKSPMGTALFGAISPE